MIWFLIGLVIGTVTIISIELISKYRNKKKKNNTNVKDKDN